MPTLSIRSARTAIFLICISNVYATPQVVFPVNSQVPPVAYAKEPFAFTFSPNTFHSDGSEISYTITNQPNWLSLNGPARSLSGTPSNADIGAQTFDLVAADARGQVTSSVTLVVQEKHTLKSNNSAILSQLAKGGSVSAPSTLVLHPLQPFAFTLTTDLFVGTTSDTKFYAVSSNTSPLPSWLQFDADSLRFSGTSPPLLSKNPSEQSTSLKLGASNVVGFSEADVSFQIVISDHVLAFKELLYSFATFRGAAFKVPSLLENLSFDGTAATRDQIASATTEPPSWLKFDQSDFSFSGTVPYDAESAKFWLVVQGIGSNSVNTTVSIEVDIQDIISQDSLGVASAYPGTYFAYTVTKSPNISTFPYVFVGADDLPSWLEFTAANLTLQGQVPTDATTGTKTVQFTFSNSTQSLTANLSIIITRETPTSTEHAAPSSTGEGIGSTPSNSAHRRLAILIVAIVLPVLTAIFLLSLFLVWCLRRRKFRPATHEEANPQQLVSEVKETSQTMELRDPSMSGAIQPGGDPPQAMNGTPRIEMSWRPDSVKRKRKRLSKKRRTTHSSITGSSWDDLLEFNVSPRDTLPAISSVLFEHRKDSHATVSLPPPAVRVPPPRPARTASQQDDLKMFQIFQPPSAVTAHVIGLPKRLSGAGHGAGSNEAFPPDGLRSSWRTTMSTVPHTASRPSTLVTGSFPATAFQGDLNAVSNEKGISPPRKSHAQPKLNRIESGSEKSELLEAARQRYHTQKSKDRLEGKMRSLNGGAKTWLESDAGYPAISGSPRRKAEVVKRANLRSNSVHTPSPPAVPQRSQARTGSDQTGKSVSKTQRSSGQPRFTRQTSEASSHQFDSALSSDSQWEDEKLFVYENEAGQVFWHTRADSSASSMMAHTPAELYGEGEAGPSRGRRRSKLRRPRLADQRKHVSIEEGDLERSERSHRGSFRFI